MIVLDASVVIALFDRDDAHHDPATAFLRSTVGRRRAISTVTLAEVLVGPTRVGRQDGVRRAVERLRIEEVGFPQDAAARLAGLRVATGLRLPDCCVLLVAQPSGTVASFDERLRVAAARLGLREPLPS